MKDAFKEIQACLKHKQHNVSTESLQMALEALRIVIETTEGAKTYDDHNLQSTIRHK